MSDQLRSPLADIAEDLERDAEELDRARRQETRAGCLEIHMRRATVHACRLLLLARGDGAAFLFGPFAPRSGRLIKAADAAADDPRVGPLALRVDERLIKPDAIAFTDNKLLWYWQFIACPWLRCKSPGAFAADAGGFDFPAVKTGADGRVIGRNGKPLLVVEDEKGTRLCGEPARMTDDYDETAWLSHLRAQAWDWSAACRTAARLLRDTVEGAPAAESLEAWAVQPASPAAGAPESPARHSPDFRSVHWFGTDHTFTQAQAAVVAILWEAWKNSTPDVGHSTLLQRAKLSSDRLPDVFKQKGKYHPAWGNMIQSNIGSKSSARLCPPGD